MAQEIFYVAAGVAVLLVALGLLPVFRRLSRTLRALEELLLTTREEMTETLPELRASVGNVNDITSALNVGVHAAEQTVGSSGRSIRSAAYGVRVGAESLFTRSTRARKTAGEQPATAQGDADVQ